MIKKTEAGAEISKSTVVRGRVQGAEALSVAGRIDGSVSLDAKLTVEKTGVVKADVDAEEVIVRGVVVGDIKARRIVRLEPGARVKGDIEAPAIAIAEGAQFAGSLNVGDVISDRPEIPEVRPSPALRYEPERVAPTEVIMRPVPEPAQRGRRPVVVKKRQ